LGKILYELYAQNIFRFKDFASYAHTKKFFERKAKVHTLELNVDGSMVLFKLSLALKAIRSYNHHQTILFISHRCSCKKINASTCAGLHTCSISLFITKRMVDEKVNRDRFTKRALIRSLSKYRECQRAMQKK